MNKPNRASKCCWICGDVALAFNHNGLSCQSCKMFFRRNYFKIKELECNFEEKCQINQQTRGHCPKCRLMKCFAIGMRHNTIGKNLSATQNKATKHLNKVIGRNLASSKGDVEQKVQRSLQIIPPRIFLNDLTEPELHFISELRNGMEVFVDERTLRTAGHVFNMLDALNMQSLYTRRIIKFCKSISAFRQINATDQLTILKGVFHEINFIRHTYLFDPEDGEIQIIGNEMADHSVVVDFGRLFGTLEAFHRVQVEIHDKIKNDAIIRDLIIALYLFKLRKSLVLPEFVNYQYMIYSRLLYRYLGVKNAKTKTTTTAEKEFFTLMRLLRTARNVAPHVLKETLPQVDHTQLDPVLKEVHGF